jgi:hypothetical protein
MATQKNTAAIEKFPPAGLARKAPAQAVPDGFENVEPQDYAIPRLNICQPLSPEKNKRHERFIEGLEEGQIFNNVMHKNLGNKIRICVAHFFKTRIKWHGTIGEGIDCRSFDGVQGRGNPGVLCRGCRFNGVNKGCTQFYNFAVIVLPDRGPVGPEGFATMSFKSTGITVAQQWLSRMRLLKDKDSKGREVLDENGVPVIAPMFGSLHDITTTQRSNEKGTWWQYDIKTAGSATEEQRASGRDLCRSMLSGKFMKQAEAEIEREAGERRKPGEDETPRLRGSFNGQSRRLHPLRGCFSCTCTKL